MRTFECVRGRSGVLVGQCRREERGEAEGSEEREAGGEVGGGGGRREGRARGVGLSACPASAGGWLKWLGRCAARWWSSRPPFDLFFAREGRHEHVLTYSNLKCKKIPAGGGRPGQFSWLASAWAVSAGRWLRWLRVCEARSRRTAHLLTWCLREEAGINLYLPVATQNPGKFWREGVGRGSFCRWQARER